MEIAKYGRTVIVDDQIEDIIELMKTLSKEGISTTYFSGELEGLPEKPLDGVSVLFLDLELNKALGSDRDKASQDIAVVNKILGSHANDGTVILVIWTTAISAFEELKSMMDQVNMRFLTEIKVEKADCKSGGSFDFDKINQILTKQLEKLSTLNLINQWDNAINIAAHRVYEKLILDAPTSHEQLEKHINTLYYKMGEAVYGKQEDINLTFGTIQVLNDILTNEICLLGEKDFLYEISNDNINPLGLDKIGNINRALNLVSAHEEMMPGTIYALNEKIKLNYFELFNDWRNVKKDKKIDLDIKKEIMCEVTPLCDYAQKRRKVFRMLPGVILPVSLDENLKKKADYIYCSPTLNDLNVFSTPFILAFDLRYLFTIDISESINDSDRIGLQLGENMLMHIQNRLGRQVSNPGITFVDRHMYT